MERMHLEFRGKVAVLKFNHPEVMNAVGNQMLDDMASALAEIKAQGGEARCLLLTGEGRAFCAGANLQDDDKSGLGREAGKILVTNIIPSSWICAIWKCPSLPW